MINVCFYKWVKCVNCIAQEVWIDFVKPQTLLVSSLLFSGDALTHELRDFLFVFVCSRVFVLKGFITQM